MSYILDALRRADAERDRGLVPGIHAQPTRHAAATIGAPGKTRRLWPWAIVAVLLLALAGLGWRLEGLETRPVSIAPPSNPPPLSSVGGPAAQTAAVESTTVAPAVVVPPPPRVAALTRSAAPAQVMPNTAQTKKTVSTAIPSRSSPDAPASAVAAASGTIYTAEELPEDIRRELPKLAIGGSIYSESAASRFVIVNGQLLHEGDTLMPGLVLQQIKLKSAVLMFRGYRYRIAL